MSPASTGSGQGYPTPPPAFPTRARGESNSSESNPTTWNPLAKGSYSSGRISPTKPSSLSRGGLATGGAVSSWSNKEDEGKSAPAWNIHQYGYMGGANAGNQGVAFGARRQITSAAPSVPSLAEKERLRKEQAAESERQKQEAEQAEARRRADFEAEEARARAEEERRWELETQKQREKERREAEEEIRRWDEERRLWKQEEEANAREERELEARLASERSRQRANSDARLNGQFLSQYQANYGRHADASNREYTDTSSTTETKKIQDLERQLAEAKEREAQYERERQQTRLQEQQAPRPLAPRQEEQTGRRLTTRETSSVPPAPPARPTVTSHEDDWQESERDYLQKQHQAYNDDGYTPPKPPRPENPTPAIASARPLPTPDTSYTPGSNRTDRFLSSNPAPAAPKPSSHRPADYSTTTEVDLENQRRLASQQKTKAGGWASKSLLEREMERERERQREWEEGQKETASKARDGKEGVGPGQSWDVHQYGYLGGDSQNRGGPGLGVGGARRQIIGPRPPP
jgi:transgelin